MNDIIWRTVKRAQIPVVKEPAGLLRSDVKRTDGATLLSQATWKLMVWYVTVSDTLAESYVSYITAEQGDAAKQAAENKTVKYQGLEKTHIFFSSCHQDSGIMEPASNCTGARNWETYHCHHRTAEKPPSCFRDCPWLCRGDMRSHSSALSRKIS